MITTVIWYVWASSRRGKKRWRSIEIRGGWARKGISEQLSLLNKVIAHFKEMDPNIKLFEGIEQMTHDGIQLYCASYEEEKKPKTKQFRHSTLYLWKTKTKQLTGDPKPWPSWQHRRSKSNHERLIRWFVFVCILACFSTKMVSVFFCLFVFCTCFWPLGVSQIFMQV